MTVPLAAIHKDLKGYQVNTLDVRKANNTQNKYQKTSHIVKRCFVSQWKQGEFYGEMHILLGFWFLQEPFMFWYDSVYETMSDNWWIFDKIVLGSWELGCSIFELFCQQGQSDKTPLEFFLLFFSWILFWRFNPCSLSTCSLQWEKVRVWKGEWMKKSSNFGG